MKEKTIANIGMVALALMLLTFGTLSMLFLSDISVMGGASTNVTVRLNVSNTEPTVTTLVIDDSAAGDDGRITLTADSFKRVYCNATVNDYNGWQDITNASAVIFVANVTKWGTQTSSGINYGSSDDKNEHYSNWSCNCAQNGADASNASCLCAFAVQYYADNGTWVCNFTARDDGGTENITNGSQFNATNTDFAGITQLLAISVPGGIDYGNLSVLETSSEQLMNVTNVGNIDINVTVRGWGGTNATPDDETVGSNLSMICALGNITLSAEKYSFETGAVYDSMTNLSITDTKFANITFRQRRDETGYGNSTNSTYWKIKVPLSVGGICNGTIAVTASLI